MGISDIRGFMRDDIVVPQHESFCFRVREPTDISAVKSLRDMSCQ